MKKYLFLKLCLTIFCCRIISATRIQVAGNPHRNDGIRRFVREDVAVVVANNQEGDTKNGVKIYQVMGKPGVDFPVLTFIPRTAFTCRGMKSGYYADLETNCQVFHICEEGRKVSFLCPNGTIFQQSDLICDWWFKVDCASSPSLYEESAEHLEEENNKRKEARKAQQAKRLEETRQRLLQANDNLAAQGREVPTRELPTREVFTQRKPTPQRYQQNVAKKDVNSYVTVFGSDYDNNKNRKADSKAYKETQVPAETASFVTRKFSEQPNYFKNINDFGVNKVTYLPQRTHADNRATKPYLEKTSRGAKTYETTVATPRPYRARNNDYLKTTTQHTIYSPTVPPYTASRYTTRIPSTRPISTTTEYFRTKPITTTTPTTTTTEITTTTTPATTTTTTIFTTTTTPPTTTSTNAPITSTNAPVTITSTPETSTTTRSVNMKVPGGFFITKVADSTTSHPVIISKQKDQINILDDDKETTTRASSTTPFRGGISGLTTKIPEITIPVEVETYKPVVPKISERSSKSYDFTKDGYTYNKQDVRLEYTTTPITISSATPGLSTAETAYDASTVEPQKSTTRDEKITTNKFNQYTYLPKATEDNSATVKPTDPTPYTSYTTIASVTDNLSNMIKTLHDLDSQDPAMDIEKLLVSRPGLHIPPSAGPNTLHSLAVYFATALDNLVATNDTEDYETTTTEAPPSTNTEEDTFVTLLSRSTVDKYNLLFNENHTEEKSNKHEDDTLDIKSLVEHDLHYNDLDGQQSQGPLSSTPRIRQLAQVFTQALSAYLDDPDTFKRVLEEIRPTEPPPVENTDDFTENPNVTPAPTEYPSYMNEEDEVLDFSDTDKSSTYSTSTTTTATTRTTEKTTERVFLNEISTSFPDDQPRIDIARDSRAQTINSLAVELNNHLPYSTSTAKSSIFEDYTTESSYLPFKDIDIDEEEAKKRLTAKPYGFGVKPEDSTPITALPESDTTTESWINTDFNQINTNLSEFQPFDALLPPYNTSQNDSQRNDENLQSEHSQSFFAHGNSIVADRKGKALINFDTTTDSTTTFKYETTTNTPTETSAFTTSIYTTTEREDETTYRSPTVYSTQTTGTTVVETTTVGTTTVGTTTTETTTIGTTTVGTTTTESTTETSTGTTTLIPESTTHESIITTYKPTTTPPESTTETYTTEAYTPSESYRTTDLFSTTEIYTTEDQTTQPTTQSVLPEDHWSTSPIVTKLWESTLFVNPLLINRNFAPKPDNNTSVESDASTTESYDFTTENYRTTETTENHLTSTTEEYTTTILPEVDSYPPTGEGFYGIHSLLNSTELEIASSQANQLFGNLDLSEQDLLMEKMKMAESNSTIRRLILLLVSTCDASLNHNKTVQETRNYILHALLGVPLNKTTEKKKVEESISVDETSNVAEPMAVTLRTRSGKALSNEDATTTEMAETTTLEVVTSTESHILTEKNSILVKAQTPNRVVDVKNVHHNTRALELLRSLYNLAAKWSKK